MAHECHATGCELRVPPSLLFCKKHWFMVPRSIQNRVWRAYRPGQEEDKRPSREYLLAARDAVVAVAEREGREPDTRLYDLMLDRTDA